MDAVRQLITHKLEETGLTMREVSLNIGRNEAFLQQYMTRGTPKELGERDRERIAPLLGIQADELRGPDNPPPSRTNGGAPALSGATSELEDLRELCRHYERALRTIVANPTEAVEIAKSALVMGRS
jgi:hypothetical protein